MIWKVNAAGFALAIYTRLTMRLSDAGLRPRTTKVVYPDHRFPPLHVKDVRENIAPFAHVAIAGKDNSALAIARMPAGAVPAADVPASGEQAFNKVCSACHTTSVNGAPKIGDHAAWGPRIAQGKETLYKDAIGGKGNMLPKGGTTWPDATIRMTVDYMVSLNK